MIDKPLYQSHSGIILVLKMAKVAIEDLSGHTTPATANPYDGLISATNNDSVWLISAS